MKTKKIRKLGEITGDLEHLLLEMTSEHDMQWHEVLGIVYMYLMVHCPNAREEYVVDGSNPEFYYGPKRDFKNKV